MRLSGFPTRTPLLVIAALAVLAMIPAAAHAQADLSIDKADSADPVTVGSQFDYTLAISNAGPETANAVTVTDTLPNDVTFISASVATYAEGSCALQGNRRVECSLGSIPVGSGSLVTIRVRADRDGQATNTASVDSSSPNDPNRANNESTEQTQIVAAATRTCAGRDVTITGTSGPDVIDGTNQADVIAGLGGDDVINGLDGKDVICTGGGDDIARGLGDNDRIKGGPGNDRARGGEGNDALAGNGGNDNLGGGAGNDVLRGGRGTDRCRGGPGTDTRIGCE